MGQRPADIDACVPTPSRLHNHNTRQGLCQTYDLIMITVSQTRKKVAAPRRRQAPFQERTRGQVDPVTHRQIKYGVPGFRVFTIHFNI